MEDIFYLVPTRDKSGSFQHSKGLRKITESFS